MQKWGSEPCRAAGPLPALWRGGLTSSVLSGDGMDGGPRSGQPGAGGWQLTGKGPRVCLEDSQTLFVSFAHGARWRDFMCSSGSGLHTWFQWEWQVCRVSWMFGCKGYLLMAFSEVNLLSVALGEG